MQRCPDCQKLRTLELAKIWKSRNQTPAERAEYAKANRHKWKVKRATYNPKEGRRQYVNNLARNRKYARDRYYKKKGKPSDWKPTKAIKNFFLALKLKETLENQKQNESNK